LLVYTPYTHTVNSYKVKEKAYNSGKSVEELPIKAGKSLQFSVILQSRLVTNSSYLDRVHLDLVLRDYKI